MAAATGATAQLDFFGKFAKILDNYPGAGLREVIRLTPDSLLLGTGFFALITQNFAPQLNYII